MTAEETPPAAAGREAVELVELVVMGGGQMGEALVDGLLRAGTHDPGSLVVAEKLEARRSELAQAEGLAGRHPGLRVEEAPVPARGAILAVKPADAESACRALAGAGVQRVLSVMAGVSLARLETWLSVGHSPDATPAVVRAMPNTPSLIGAGAAAIAAGSAAGGIELDWARHILASVGTVVEVPETLLDAVTGLSGSGPAYVFLFAEALIDAGVLVGLPRPVARDLVVQTVLGSARLLVESGQSPEALRARVTSPGGTTAAGLRALEGAAVRHAVLEAVAAATERSRQMGV